MQKAIRIMGRNINDKVDVLLAKLLEVKGKLFLNTALLGYLHLHFSIVTIHLRTYELYRES